MKKPALALCLLLAACAANPADAPPAPDVGPVQTGTLPLWDDLGTFHRAVQTTSPEAQRYFDQGLVLSYGFNHDEAVKAFEEAVRLDPSCAMAWWGIAYARGPHINNTAVDEASARASWAAVERARRCEPTQEVERGLIEALAARVSEDATADRAKLDAAYVEAMRALWEKFPKDADVGALYAEAMMNVHPWDLWTNDGQPKHDVLEVVKTLEAVQTLAPDHPHANHLYIHALEASPEPGRALEAADRLRSAVPGSSHLVHMPSHIDVRTGRWAEACAANERAMAADRRHPDAPGFYRLYMLHNVHMLAFASMMEGRFQGALEAARAMVAGVPPAALEGDMGPFLDGFMPVVLHVLVRFGRWEDALQEPPFPAHLPAANAVRHYARGVSLGALGRLEEAEVERAALAKLLSGMDDRPLGNNPAKVVLRIPLDLLSGELAFRRGRTAEALGYLRRAVETEAELRYDEPPDWMTPARHPYAAALMAAGRHAQAEAVLREDLRLFPDNGWSLVGLAACLRARGAEDEAREVDERLRRAWARADVQITSPCLCLPAGR